jgi:RNA polymerase sigma factor (sigma-70 family)
MTSTARGKTGASGELGPGQGGGANALSVHHDRPPRRLTAEQRGLAEEHWEYALKIAEWFARRYPAIELDWEGAVGVGICEAAESYRSGEGTAFKTHAGTRCRGACLDLMRSQRIKGYGRIAGYLGAPAITSLYAPLWTTAEGMVVRRDHLVASEDLPVGWELESQEEVKRLTRSLPGRFGVAIRLLYLHAETGRQKATAAALGLSESRVNQIHSRAIETLREVAC